MVVTMTKSIGLVRLMTRWQFHCNYLADWLLQLLTKLLLVVGLVHSDHGSWCSAICTFSIDITARHYAAKKSSLSNQIGTIL